MNSKLLLFFVVLFSSLVGTSQAQFKNNVWCFGDSAGIKFEPGGTTQLFNSSTVTSGGSCSISDSAGNLLFYANTDYYFLWTQGSNRLGVVWDRNHNLMQNGDTITGGLSFQEQVIVPWPDSSNLFYIFNVGLFTPYGFWYSVVDMNQNGGLGAVVQKNVQLTSYQASDCVAAVKHGNGRDWWVYFRRWDTSNNEYYRYLVTPSGISGPFIQNVGTVTNNGFMHSCFSKDGSMYLAVDYRGMIEVFDVDRCSGLFSNLRQIELERTVPPIPKYTGSAFSFSGRYIYVSSTDDPQTYLYQFDLQAPNISNSKTLISSVSTPSYFGYMRLAPDNKIYCSLLYNDGNQTYPYSDSLNNQFNQNMCVINSPDSAGALCDFSPFSFYLGGNETYWGMPNNPEYDLPALAGSSCDTLLGLTDITLQPNPELSIYYSPTWQTAFINAQKLQGHIYNLSVYDLLGNEVFKEKGKLNPPFFTKNLNCTAFAKGMYVVVLQTDMERLTKKFVIE